MIDRVLPFLNHHVDAATGSILGLAMSAPIAVGAVQANADAPWWAGYIVTLLIALAPVALKALLGANGKKIDPDTDKAIDAVDKVAGDVAERVLKPSAPCPPNNPEVKP